MSSFWNHNISISIFGESHGPAIGVTMDNLPPGEYIDLEQLREFMARRAPRQDATSTHRKEADLPSIMSGMLNNRTTGTPLMALSGTPTSIPRITETSPTLHAPAMRIIQAQ